MVVRDITCKMCGIVFTGYHNMKHCKPCKKIAFCHASDRFRTKNREKVLETQKAYKKTTYGRLVSIVSNAKRRARINNIIHEFTYKQWKRVVLNTKGICQRCGRYVGYEGMTLDHIYPISKAEKGRVYTINDIQPLCLACNIAKFNKIEYKR